MVDAYVNRKHGRETPVYSHPVMEEILAETFGVMVYQEQIMRILNRLGGIELSSAYVCIKAISKKKHDIIDQRRAEFIQGAQERGLAKKQAEEIFELIVVFGGYGFNKSHTAAYAQVGYQTAYLKTHYTAEFMAALLSSEIEDSNKRDIMVQHIEDARKLGVPVRPPDVNAGEVEFAVRNGEVLFGLTAIKGVGRGAAGEIVRARKDRGPFRDIFDLCERVDLKLVPRAALERLIKAGALDCLGARRAQLMAVLPQALQAARGLPQPAEHEGGVLASCAGRGAGEVERVFVDAEPAGLDPPLTGQEEHPRQQGAHREQDPGSVLEQAGRAQELVLPERLVDRRFDSGDRRTRPSFDFYEGWSKGVQESGRGHAL